jgi:hypothetical protein
MNCLLRPHHQPKSSTLRRPSSHRHIAVAPGLVTDPRDRIVAVLAVVEEPIVHALGAFRADVAAGGLAWPT